MENIGVYIMRAVLVYWALCALNNVYIGQLNQQCLQCSNALLQNQRRCSEGSSGDLGVLQNCCEAYCWRVSIP